MIKGYLDYVTATSIRGWIFNSKNESEPLNVFIFVDNKQIGSTLANTLRAGVKEKGIHKTGKCGFIFSINADLLANKSLTIAVKVKFQGKLIDIPNSPYLYNDEAYIKELVEQLKNKKPNKYTSTLITGLGKSGTSALIYKVGNSFKNCQLNFEPGGIYGLSDIRLHQKLSQINKNVVTKSLFIESKTNYLSSICKLYDKKIWIIRDPRDRLISDYLYSWYKFHNPQKSHFDEAYKFVKIKENDPNKIAMSRLIRVRIDMQKFIKYQIRLYDKLINQVEQLKKDGDWIIFKYEDLIDNNYTKLSEYLGVEIKPTVEVEKKFKRVVRSKSYGSWRNWFVERELARFKKAYNKPLKYFDYDFKDWRLNEIQKLQPEIGSEYMLKLYNGNLK